MKRLRGHAGELLLVALTSAATFLLSFRAPVTAANSDMLYSLTVSLALLEQGTIRLDDYRDRTDPPLPQRDYRLLESNGHLHHAFPLGTALFATPAVAVAQGLGRDMLVITEQNRITNGLAALSSGLIFALLYVLARIYLRPRAAFPLALIFMLGTSLISSLGAGLWSHHGAVIAALLVLILLAAAEEKEIPRVPGAVIGLLLFLAYLFRPAQSPFIALVLLFLAYRGYQRQVWRPLLGAAGVSGGLFLLFLLFSRAEFGAWFPGYYAPERVGAFTENDPIRAFYGLLFSPGRGLFIFSPVLLLLPAATLRFRQQIRFHALLALVLLWLPLQMALVYATVVWWGGWSYGPRLLSDVLPGLLLWALLLWRAARPAVGRREQWGWLGALALLGGVSIIIHAGSGLHNVHAQRWNGALPPNVDQEPRYLFQWRYPQFLATAEQLCMRNADYVAALNESEPLPSVKPGEDFTEDKARYQGWSWPPATEGVRRSECAETHIYFRTPAPRSDASGEQSPRLVIQAGAVDPRPVPVAINGSVVDTLYMEPGETIRYEVPVSRTLLLESGVNRLTLRVPGAGEPLAGWGAWQRRGIVLQGWALTFVDD